jgi:cystathionine gamma-synthase
VDAKGKRWKRATLAIHGDRGEPPCLDVAPPLHVTTTFERSDDGFEYSREDQPTRKRLETLLGRMEGGVSVTYPSGQAAAAAILAHCKPRRVSVDRGYFGTHELLDALAAQGVERIRLNDELRPGDLVWLETPKNPGCELEDIALHAERAHAAGAELAVDSTLATPALQKPLALGADIVMHSSSKFLGGHSDALGGVVVVRDPERALALRREREITGAIPGALETWLTLRSLRTLVLRLTRQSATAMVVATWLSDNVRRVSYPGLTSHPQYALACRQMRGGGGMLAFELDSEMEAKDVADSLTLFRRAVSLGGVESLIDWRHEFDALCPANLLRASIGLESAEDLIQDLHHGMTSVQARYLTAHL